MRFVPIVPASLVVLVLIQTPMRAQDDADQAMQITEQMRDAYLKAYNAHDAEAVAALYTEEADVVYPNGQAIRGRAQILGELKRIFAEHENVKLAIEPKVSRFITRRVVLVDGVTEVTDGPEELPPRTHHTVVFQRGQDDQWQIAAIRLTVPPERQE
jgi:uncharacterized protein (TIGR02246 family)